MKNWVAKPLGPGDFLPSMLNMDALTSFEEIGLTKLDEVALDNVWKSKSVRIATGHLDTLSSLVPIKFWKKNNKN